MNLFQASQNMSRTENGALTFKSSGSPLLDFFYQAPARRHQDNRSLFAAALKENVVLAVTALFNLRDIRGGKGERDTFRKLLGYLRESNEPLFETILPLVPVYGRWDDILPYWDNHEVIKLVGRQLMSDLDSDKPSLLAKWMPSENASSFNTKQLAKQWIKMLNMEPAQYRRALSSIRARLNVLERQMSAGDWGSISYSGVPSKASLKYRKAFGKHDAERYAAYLNNVQKGTAKMNAGTLFPHDVVSQYVHTLMQDLHGPLNGTVEAAWKSLPNYANSPKGVLVVADQSGSMEALVPGTKVSNMVVAVSLAMYFAERNTGLFHNKAITFTNDAQFIDYDGTVSLMDKINRHAKSLIGFNTNLQSVFNLILTAATAHHLPVEEMPTQVWIISDMEFDAACKGTNLNTIRSKYKAAGYPMPKIVFWNLASRTQNVPANMADEGVALVSGYSAAIAQTLLTGVAITPFDTMIEVLTGNRYEPVRAALGAV